MPCTVVLGPPRSGTSMLTSILHKSGIDMGEESWPTPATPDRNTGGNMEDQRTQYMNHYALKIVSHFPVAMLPPVQMAELNQPPWDLPDPVESFPPYIQQMAERFVAERESTGKRWGFKDSSTALCVRAWERILTPCRPTWIFIRRDPAAAAHSLKELWHENGAQAPTPQQDTHSWWINNIQHYLIEMDSFRKHLDATGGLYLELTYEAFVSTVDKNQDHSERRSFEYAQA